MKKTIYCFFIFLFFPLAWLNHFRLLPGHPALHYVGFVALIFLSLYILAKLGDDEKLSTDFRTTINDLYLKVLVLNIVIYIIAWIWRGGPGFTFADGSGWLKMLVFVIYVLWILFYCLASGVKATVEERESWY